MTLNNCENKLVTDNWEYKTLDQMGRVQRGRSRHRPRNDARLFGGKYPFIQTADVKNAPFYISEYTETYNEIGLAQSKLWDVGTLCITLAANIADTGILAIPACFPDSVLGFRAYDDISDVRFVKYCFDILQKDCKQISQGTAQDNLSWEKLSTIKFPCPPIEVQRKIADVLSAYDDLIENNRKQIKLLEESAQRLYKEWFIDLRFPGHETTPIIDGIPEGWEKKKIEDVCPIMTGKRDANFGCSSGQYLFFTCSQEPIKSASYSFDTSAVILAGNGDFNVKLYRGKFEAYQRTYVLSPENLDMIFLLYGTVQTNMRELTQKASGSTIKFLTRGMIANIEIIVPHDNLLTQYNNMSNAIQTKIEMLKKSVQSAIEIRDRLLPKLMTGELEVSHD